LRRFEVRNRGGRSGVGRGERRVLGSELVRQVRQLRGEGFHLGHVPRLGLGVRRRRRRALGLGRHQLCR
jgi:hypothetical protein